jgi:DNA repair protein RAD16
VLDESHTIKNPKPAQSQACLALSGTKRWCVTGTPIETGVGDLLGQLMFLKLAPWDNHAYFESACTLLLRWRPARFV